MFYSLPDPEGVAAGVWRFAKPYYSWERGSNENLNGLIRQYIPKQTDFDPLSDEFIQHVQDQINSRPRKRFNFDTPINEFKRLTQ